MKTQKFLIKYKKSGLIQRLNVFNLHDRDNTDINFDYHFEPNKGWMEIFLNSKISYKKTYLEEKINKDPNESLKNNSILIRESSLEYYRDITKNNIEFSYLFDNYKGEKLTIEKSGINSNFNQFHYKLDNDCECFKGKRYLIFLIWRI